MPRVLEDDLVSVILPVYNSEEFIGETIESVLKQTYKKLEIIIINDCSTDRSEELILEYQKNFQQIIYIKLPHNSGVAVARNTGLEEARGRYVAFLDSDDLWMPAKLEKQIELMKGLEAPISYTAIEMIDEKNQIVKGKRTVLNKVDYSFLLKNTMIATSTVIVDRVKTGLFFMPLLRSGQDYGTWLQLLRNGNVACGLNETLVQYRRRSGSLSSNKFKSIKQVWTIQVEQEQIHPLKATIHAGYFIWNAFKKHFF